MDQWPWRAADFLVVVLAFVLTGAILLGVAQAVRGLLDACGVHMSYVACVLLVVLFYVALGCVGWKSR